MDLLAKLSLQPGGEQLIAASEQFESDVFLVGGAVRDLLLGREPAELDVVVTGGAIELAGRLAGRLSHDRDRGASGRSAPIVHDRFGTATVEWSGERIDVAERRAESYSCPGALPDVRAGTLEEDLLRRDFTVNAIAVALDGDRPGELHTVANALDDLRARRLRVLHDASFLDDPTRLLRLARYAARLGFEIEPHTAELAGSAVQARALDTVSGARIGAELRLALSEPDAVGAFAAMDALGLLSAIHPRLRFDRTMIERSVDLLPDDGRRDLLTMAAVTLPLALRADRGSRDLRSASDGSGAEIAALLNRLEFPAPDRNRIVAAAAAVPRLVSELPGAQSPSQLYDAVEGVPPEGIALAGGVDETAAEPARRWLDCLRHVHLSITGEDLLAAGLSEGPDIGRRLDRVLRMKLDGTISDGRGAELSAALEAQP